MVMKHAKTITRALMIQVVEKCLDMVMIRLRPRAPKVGGMCQR